MSRPAPSQTCITGIGLVTPAGPNAPASCRALRAGVSCFDALLGFWASDDEGVPVPIQGATIPTELPTEPGHLRLASYCARAVREALADAKIGPFAPGRLKLYLGHDPHLNPWHLFQVLALEMDGAGTPVSFPNGRCAALAALAEASKDLAAGRVDIAMVGGADSLVDPGRLFRLAAAGRLMTPKNRTGLIPGEAAGFLVLETWERAFRRKAKPYARLAGIGVSQEPTGGTDEPCRGEGLTRALRAALDAACHPGARTELPLIVCDMNGDHYRSLEWGLASVRAMSRLGGDRVLWHPADCIGDCGAGLGPVNLAWAATALREGYARSSEVLVWGASEGKARAAAVLVSEKEGA